MAAKGFNKLAFIAILLILVFLSWDFSLSNPSQTGLMMLIIIFRTSHWFKLNFNDNFLVRFALKDTPINIQRFPLNQDMFLYFVNCIFLVQTFFLMPLYLAFSNTNNIKILKRRHTLRTHRIWAQITKLENIYIHLIQCDGNPFWYSAKQTGYFRNKMTNITMDVVSIQKNRTRLICPFQINNTSCKIKNVMGLSKHFA